MKTALWPSIRIMNACLLAMLFAFPQQHMFGHTHVVSSRDLQEQAAATSQARQRSLQKVDEFFSSAEAQQALRNAHMDATQVKSAVAQLNNDDLARVAAQADRAQKDFAGGSLGEHRLELLVIAIAVVVVIILVVKL